MFATINIADTYDQIALDFSATRQKLSPILVGLLPVLPSGASVLDLGCGNGVLTTALPKDIDYTGIDISRELLKQASKTVFEAKFILADITDDSTWQDLPQYDFIAALAVLHHLPEDKALFVLKQIRAHLQPTGTILVGIWRLDLPKFDKFRHGRHLSIPFHKGIARDFYSYTEEELVGLVKKAGLTTTKIVTTKNNLYLLLRL